jgi:probable F420-dependent oxidoreductase
MAADTCHAQVGALVTCFTYRNPQLLADMARTIDHISEGRFVLGLGSGWFERDYTEYGYEFGTAVDRLKLLEAGLPVIKDRMKKLNPQPVNGNIPIMIGGGGEKRTLRLVAEHAQQYNYFGPPESYANKIKILDEWCAKVGRNPKEIERTVAIYPNEVTPELFEAYQQAGAEHIILTSAGPFDMKDLETLLSWR